MSVPLDLVAWLVQERYLISLFYAIRQNWLLTSPAPLRRAYRPNNTSFLYIQLFHHQSYGHTFPVPNEPTKSEVHQIPSHPAIICIELSHFSSLFTVLDGFPIEFLSCSVRCDIIATTIHTGSSSDTVPSVPEVF